MNVSYTTPIAQAWARMQRMLFRPFRLEGWLVLALAVFLANIGGSFSGASNSLNFRDHGPSRLTQIPEATRERILGWLTNPAVLLGFAAVLLMVLVVALVFSYVSARAEFVFLENVARERPAFSAPWGRFGELGRSLFLLRAGLSFLYLIPLSFVAVPLWSLFAALLRGEDFHPSMLPGLLLAGAFAAAAMLAVGFIHLCNQDFVVPLMYARGIRSREGWGAFLPLLRERAGDFIAYALLMMVIEVLVAIAVLVAGALTCCVGLILVSIPYVNSVVLLPLHTARRAIGPEFLAQYGAEWVTLPPPGHIVEP